MYVCELLPDCCDELLLGCCDGLLELLDGDALLELLEGDELLVLLDGDWVPVSLDGEDELELAPCDDAPNPPLLLCADPPCTPSAASVWLSSSPDEPRFCFCWNCFSADFVFGPITPSIAPGLSPLSFRACCTSRTSALLLLLPLCRDDEPMPPEVALALPLLEAPWSWLFCDRLDDDCAFLPSDIADDDFWSWLCDMLDDGLGLLLMDECFDGSFANTAVLETANAATTSWESFICTSFPVSGSRAARCTWAAALARP